MFFFFFLKSLLLIQVKWQNCFLAAFKNRACIHLNLVSALASLGYDPKKKRKQETSNNQDKLVHYVNTIEKSFIYMGCKLESFSFSKILVTTHF